MPEAQQHHLRDDRRRVRHVHRARGDPRDRRPEHQQSGGHDRPRAQPGGQETAGDRGHRDAHRDGEYPGAGRQGVVAADDLEVLRHQEDEPGEREEGHRHGAARGTEPPVREQGHVEHRVLRAPLGDDERHEQHGGPRTPRASPPIPSPVSRLDDRPDQQPEHPAGEHQAAPVERGSGRVAQLGDQEGGEGCGDESEGCEREEHAAPGEVSEQDPAHDRTGRDADPDHGAPAAQSGGPLPTVGERVGDHREGGGEDERREDAHDDARGDQRAVRADQPADGARRSEPHETDEQRRPASVPVGEAPGREDQGGERQVVAVDDPLQRPRPGPQLPGDARQRHVDDRRVEVDGEDRGVDRDQDSGLALHGDLATERMWTVSTSRSAPQKCGQCQHVARIEDVKAYHHGNLRAELLRTAVDLAREEGPSGVVLREVARRAGVSHNAAYRHFADREELLAATAEAGQDELSRAMANRAARVRGSDPADRSVRRLARSARRTSSSPCGSPDSSRPPSPPRWSARRPARSLRAAQHRPRRDGRVRHPVTRPPRGRRGGLLVGRARVRPAAHRRTAEGRAGPRAGPTARGDARCTPARSGLRDWSPDDRPPDAHEHPTEAGPADLRRAAAGEAAAPPRRPHVR